MPERKWHFWRWLLLLVLLGATLWCAWVYRQIVRVAEEDQAQTADAIAVFGAAEYGGRPSPVLHARLDKAVALYRLEVAPVIVTLGGGSEKDSGRTEGGVGRDYLLANGVPYDKIIPETRSVDTEQQVQVLADLARASSWQHIVVVSDGSHLFRIRELCRQAGLNVWTSPRAIYGRITPWDYRMRILHEIVSYTAVRLHVPASFVHRWWVGAEDL
ncbi:YdcF family protein [Terriglobus tenax]|uniref:YdcF family protein n=1 Tax=Terriglobus tenax TaxID=1111115 RepID=UPI0021DF6C5D|nr:YdcF family protein [Terriglobus tenax]